MHLLRILSILIISILFIFITLFSPVINRAMAVNEGSWILTGNMNGEHLATTLLPDRKILVIGGNMVEKFDPATNSWTVVNNEMFEAGTATLLKDGKILALGLGYYNPNTQELLNVGIYNPENNNWSLSGNIELPRRAWHTATRLKDGNVFVTGGLGSYLNGDGGIFSTIDLYHYATKTWTHTAPMMSGPRAFHTATLLQDGRVLIVGGCKSEEGQVARCPTAELYNPSTNMWSSTGNTLSERIGHTATLLSDGKILVVGGSRENDGVVEASASTELYDPQTDKWTTKRSLNFARTQHASALLPNGKVLVAGGVKYEPDGVSSTTLNSAEIYDSSTDTWSVIAPMNIGRVYSSSVLLSDGKVLIISGLDGPDWLGGSSVLASAEIYDPGDLTDPPVPFLDLPWDYKKGLKSFTQQAFNPYSWFDHQYPLQNVTGFTKKALMYDGIERDVYYRSHNGYDYSRQNGVVYKTSVLAAASGIATFYPKGPKDDGLGNYIKIDHPNGYQTWYGHLDDENHISGTQGINEGDKIGEAGYTGNVYPKNPNGAHIHFSVFKDANSNNNFNDDYPYGLVDPLGWNPESEFALKTDPWTLWGNNNKFGEESYNLFIERLLPVKQNIIADEGGVIEDDKVKIIIPGGSFPVNATVNLDKGPFELDGTSLTGIVPSLIVTAKSLIGDLLGIFSLPVKITYDYSEADITNIKQDSIKFYYFNENKKGWQSLKTVDHDQEAQIITAETDHFSRFALMGELKDKISPQTEVIIQGDKGKDTWYHTSITLEFSPKDNEGGLGVADTLYTLDGKNWQYYTSPLSFENEGKYTITYQSRDNANNLEDQKSSTFYIDKTPPKITISTDPGTIWPPNGKIIDIKINGSSSDENLFTTTFKVIDEYDRVEPVITQFGQTIQFEAKRDGNDKNGREYIIQATAQDLAGNKTVAATTVIVPHDQRK